MGQALYRKYRSMSLGEIVGQDHVTKTLETAIKGGRISHAYLFTGPRGVGKTSIARILAHAINDIPYTNKSHLDIIEIDAASNRRIDDIRDLRDKVFIAPVQAKYKVYIIDEVHMLTSESFNALLKTLEEPPAHVVFILATTESHKLPATIISRTQRYVFRAVEAPFVIKQLKFIADQEKIRIEPDALQIIAEHGDGSMRDSISLLDQLANISGGQITAAAVIESLGLAPQAALKKLEEALLEQDHSTIVTQLEALRASGVTTPALISQLLKSLQNLAKETPKLYSLIDNLIEVPRAYDPQIKLMTLLIKYCLPNPTSPSQLTIRPKTAVQAKPDNSPKPKIAEPEPAVTPPQSSKATKSNDRPLTNLSDAQWAEVLAQVKRASTPLQTMLKQAQPELDTKEQKLTLRFKTSFSSKKFEEARAKSILADALIAVLGQAPMIDSIVDKTIEPPKNQETTKPDDIAQSVAALMANEGENS